MAIKKKKKKKKSFEVLKKSEEAKVKIGPIQSSTG